MEVCREIGSAISGSFAGPSERASPAPPGEKVSALQAQRAYIVWGCGAKTEIRMILTVRDS